MTYANVRERDRALSGALTRDRSVGRLLRAVGGFYSHEEQQCRVRTGTPATNRESRYDASRERGLVADSAGEAGAHPHLHGTGLRLLGSNGAF